MVLKIRLARFGKRHAPFYNIVLAQERSARNSKPLEVLGTYDPIPKTPLPTAHEDGLLKKFKDVKLDISRTKYWLGVGAQPSDPAWKILAMIGLVVPKSGGRKVLLRENREVLHSRNKELRATQRENKDLLGKAEELYNLAQQKQNELKSSRLIAGQSVESQSTYLSAADERPGSVTQRNASGVAKGDTLLNSSYAARVSSADDTSSDLYLLNAPEQSQPGRTLRYILRLADEIRTADVIRLLSPSEHAQLADVLRVRMQDRDAPGSPDTGAERSDFVEALLRGLHNTDRSAQRLRPRSREQNGSRDAIPDTPERQARRQPVREGGSARRSSPRSADESSPRPRSRPAASTPERPAQPASAQTTVAGAPSSTEPAQDEAKLDEVLSSMHIEPPADEAAPASQSMKQAMSSQTVPETKSTPRLRYTSGTARTAASDPVVMTDAAVEKPPATTAAPAEEKQGAGQAAADRVAEDETALDEALSSAEVEVPAEPATKEEGGKK